MAYQDGRELGWDDTIENDGEGFVLLPEGDYDFTVEGFERERHGGSDKIPPCNKAVLMIGVTAQDGAHATIRTNLFLHSKFEWKLCQFFTSIGHRKHGEPLKMNWGAVMGAKGRCKVKERKWSGDDGKERSSNEIETFYEPAADAAPAFTPGAF